MEEIKQTTQPVSPPTDKATPPESTPVAETKETGKVDTKTTETGLEADRAKADPTIDGPYQQSPLFHMVANYFNIEQKDYDTVAPKIGAIVDWVQDKYGVKSQEDILLKIREAEDMIQRPGWDEKRYANLYKYVYLDNQVLGLEKAKKAFERRNNG